MFPSRSEGRRCPEPSLAVSRRRFLSISCSGVVGPATAWTRPTRQVPFTFPQSRPRVLCGHRSLGFGASELLQVSPLEKKVALDMAKGTYAPELPLT